MYVYIADIKIPPYKTVIKAVTTKTKEDAMRIVEKFYKDKGVYVDSIEIEPPINSNGVEGN